MNIKPPIWHVLQDEQGEWYWHKQSRNGTITAKSIKTWACYRSAGDAAIRDAIPWYRDVIIEEYTRDERLNYVAYAMFTDKTLVVHNLPTERN